MHYSSGLLLAENPASWVDHCHDWNRIQGGRDGIPIYVPLLHNLAEPRGIESIFSPGFKNTHQGAGFVRDILAGRQAGRQAGGATEHIAMFVSKKCGFPFGFPSSQAEHVPSANNSYHVKTRPVDYQSLQEWKEAGRHAGQPRHGLKLGVEDAEERGERERERER